MFEANNHRRCPNPAQLTCAGGHSYKITEASDEQFFGEQSGTKIVLHLREEAQEGRLCIA